MPAAFDQGVYMIVRAIPPGRVMTYGGIAALLPTPVGLVPDSFRRIRARWVGYAMTRAPDDVPWQRVVSASGGVSPRVAGGSELQLALLRREGVRVNALGRVNLNRLAWSPSRAWLVRHGIDRASPGRRPSRGG